MPVVTRIQLYCANHETCGTFFPPDAPLDGAIFTHKDLRAGARKRAGFVQRVDDRGNLVDVCPACDAAGFPKVAR